MKRLLLAVLCLWFAVPALAAEGYRSAPYRAPTPDSAPGATTLHFTDDVRYVLESLSAVAINVGPLTLSPPNAAGQRIWIPRHNHPMRQIPGSVWLPSVGYDRLDPDMMAYFRDSLETLTGGDRQRPLLIYCTADCWMSWNAVKRASEELGYQRIYWYPAGTDGWQGDGLPLVEATPRPFSSPQAR